MVSPRSVHARREVKYPNIESPAWGEVWNLCRPFSAHTFPYFFSFLLGNAILTTPWRHTHKFPISLRDWFYDHIQSGQSPNAIEYHNLLGGCDTQSHLDFDPDAFERRSSSHQSISHETACTMNVFSFWGSFQKRLYIHCLLVHAPIPWTQTRKPRTVTTLATGRWTNGPDNSYHGTQKKKKGRKKLRRSSHCHCSTDRSIQNEMCSC